MVTATNGSVNGHTSATSTNGVQRTHRLMPREPPNLDDLCGKHINNKGNDAAKKPTHGKYEGEPRKLCDAGPVLPVSINDGERRSVPVTDLLKPESADDLEKTCRKAGKPPIFFLDDLLSLTHQERWAVLSFIASLDCYRVAVGEARFQNVFDGALALMVSTDNMALYERGKLAALETAVLLYPEALDGASTRIVQRLRELKVTGIKQTSILSEAKQLQKSLQRRPAIEAVEQRVRDILPDAPVADVVVVPRGWRLSLNGVERIVDGGVEPGMAWPVILTELSRDGHRNTQALTLAWLRDGKWHQRVVDRDIVANSRSVVDLAAFGLSVNSNNARQVVGYIADFEAQNLDKLPVTKFSRQMGWQGDEPGDEGFIWGQALITADGVQKESQGQTPPAFVHYRGADEGDDQIAEGFRKRGKLARWLEAIAPIADYPRVKLALYAGLSPPMLAIFDSANYIVGYSGRNSTGKTTTLRVAASAWGDPDERSRMGAAISTWDGTAVWRERAPAVLNNLPFILDDTKRAKTKEDVGNTIYAVAQGRGRGRGSVKGLARQETWQTVMLTNGEQPTTSFTPDGGSRARVLELWGSPFEATDAETIELVSKLNRDIRCDYGHAGPHFVRYLLQHRDDWKAWRDAYDQLVRTYETWADGDPIAGRLAAHFAVIRATAWLAHQALELPWEYEDPIEPLWEQLTKEAAEGDRAAVALRHVASWAYAHQTEFFGRGDRQPMHGWVGRWDSKDVNVPNKKKKTGLWGWIGFFPARLNEILEAGGFQPDATLRDWRQRDWLLLDTEDDVVRNQHKTRIGSETVRLVAVTRQAIEEVEEHAS